jgi:small subunit ribosomal protein S20
MPQTKSAAKRLRQDTVRQERNRATKRALRNQIRKVRDAIKAGDAGLAQTEFKVAVVKLDRAAARKVIHRNAAARTKSRLSAAIKKTKQPAK